MSFIRSQTAYWTASYTQKNHFQIIFRIQKYELHDKVPIDQPDIFYRNHRIFVQQLHNMDCIAFQTGNNV